MMMLMILFFLTCLFFYSKVHDNNINKIKEGYLLSIRAFDKIFLYYHSVLFYRLLKLVFKPEKTAYSTVFFGGCRHHGEISVCKERIRSKFAQYKKRND